MVRRYFYAISATVLILLALLAAFWSSDALWALVVLGPLVALGLYDCIQTQHTVLRNFPIIGHGRYLMEMIRPETQQYFIESNIDAYPIEREYRSLVYQRAKGELDTRPFGTQRDVYKVGYEWAGHSIDARQAMQEEPRISIGGPDCTQPYSSSLLNISAMSFGALSRNAILALSRGAREGGFAHNTGEGGVSPAHLEGGGDLIWQVGTGYFGCRARDGSFDPGRFAEQSRHEHVKMIELKLSQGAKPGHGGILPGVKVTREIAEIRGVEAGHTVFSPPAHSAFSSPRGLLEFVAKLRELSGGKPTGFKLCIGRRTDFFAICKAMLETGITPDFISVDGGEGGTGAAPLEFSNSIGMPARDAWIFAHSALRGVGVRDRIKIVASGKILSGFHMLRALAVGADVCAAARGMMLSLGCIQALRCNTDRCPTGIATQNPALIKGLVVSDKMVRVRNYHQETIRSFLELLGSLGLEHPDDLRPYHVFRRIDDLLVHNFAELYDFLEPEQLLRDEDVPEPLRDDWKAANADFWRLKAEAGGIASQGATSDPSYAAD
jgi:glutamate synthase domain-containing protein 2